MYREVAMRQREWMMVALVSVLLCGCRATKSAGSGSPLRVNFTEAAKSADARTRPANQVVFDIGRLPELPSNPTTGTRKQVPAAAPATARTLPIRPCLIAVFPCAFEGVAQDSCASCGPPPDPNAAAGAGRIVEVVNDLIQVTNRMG